MTTIASMTLEDLKRLIEEAIDARFTHLLGQFELEDDNDSNNTPSWDEIRALVTRHRWTPPPAAKSSLTLLREDREG